jgi:hypothetical protein
VALRTERLLASFANQLNAGSMFGRIAGATLPTSKRKRECHVNNECMGGERD